MSLILIVALAWGIGYAAGKIFSSGQEQPRSEDVSSSATGEPRRPAAGDPLATGRQLPSFAPAAGNPDAPYEPPQTFEKLKQETSRTAAELRQRFPRDPEVLASLAELAGVFGDKELAEDYWRQCVEAAPQSPTARYAVTWFAMRQGKYDEMARLAREALTVSPESAPEATLFRDFLGHALIELGRPHEAVAALQPSAAGETASCDTYTLLGKACLLQKDYEQAVEHYRRAVELDPQWAPAHYGLATACARAGRTEQAKESFERFQRTRSVESVRSDDQQLAAALRDVGVIYRKIAACYRRRGDSEKAQRLLWMAGQLDPSGSAGGGPVALPHRLDGQNLESRVDPR